MLYQFYLHNQYSLANGRGGESRKRYQVSNCRGGCVVFVISAFRERPRMSNDINIVCVVLIECFRTNFKFFESFNESRFDSLIVIRCTHVLINLIRLTKTGAMDASSDATKGNLISINIWVSHKLSLLSRHWLAFDHIYGMGMFFYCGELEIGSGVLGDERNLRWSGWSSEVII